MPKLAFPHGHHLPAQSVQLPPMFSVVDYIPGEFIGPKPSVALGCVGHFTPPVSMPEAAMHEYNRAVLGHNDVGLARQRCHMDSESVAGPMEERTDGNLGAGVLTPDLGHQPTSL